MGAGKPRAYVFFRFCWIHAIIERGLFRSGSTPEFAEYLLHKTQFKS
jgi:hypothetical protein